VVLAPGVTIAQLQSMIKISPGPGFNRYWIDPKLIGADGRANPEFLLPASTPGEQAQLIYLRSTNTWNLDASLNKSVGVGPNGLTIAIQIGATNVLNHPIWSPPGFLSDVNITSTTFGQTTSP